MTEKKIRVQIDVKRDHPKHRAAYGMKELRNQIAKHFRTKDYVIDNDINTFFWKEGKSNWPTRVSLVAVEENKKLYIFLEGSEGYNKFKNKGKETKSEKEKKAKTNKDSKTEAKSETKKEESKLEVKEKSEKKDIKDVKENKDGVLGKNSEALKKLRKNSKTEAKM